MILFVLGGMVSFAQTKDSSRTIMEKKDNFNALDIIKGDTLKRDIPRQDQTNLPGGVPDKFTSEQDSAYFRALKLRLPIASRFNQSLDELAPILNARVETAKGTPWEIAVANINAIPSSMFVPTGQEQVLYRTNIENSMATPLGNNLNKYGMKVSLGDIAQFFGLAEDVSPVIKYSLDFATEVQIVIYSVNAAVVATLFDGHQPAGSYTITWNGRDDKGRKLPSGDYVAEVRIGTLKYVRKRILVP